MKKAALHTAILFSVTKIAVTPAFGQHEPPPDTTRGVVSSTMPTTYIRRDLADALRIGMLQGAQMSTIPARTSGGVMSLNLFFARKWNAWYRVLRYRNGFTFVDSVRCGLWLARG
jgi:hypothetical protein